MRTSEQLIELGIAGPRKGAAVRLVASVWTSVTSAWRILKNRRAINRLSDLDDFQLNDIGLTRPEVNEILRTTALREDPSRRFSRSARNRAQKALHGL